MASQGKTSLRSFNQVHVASQHLLVFHLYKSCFMGTWIDGQLLTLMTDEQRKKKLGWVHQYLGLGWVHGHIPLTRWRGK
jgi:hypothetical protein